jgi:preprotein translocase subunit SecF
MRSINTSLISALPIIALMVIAVWLLGVGTLQDLALVQLVGVLVGTYSSIYFATPLLVSLRERTDLVGKHTKRVLRRRAAAAARTDADADVEIEGDDTVDDSPADAVKARPAAPAGPAPDKPAPGARPLRPNRPSGKRRT